jgi:hypothetical protein
VKFGAVVHAAGGWVGGTVADSTLFANSDKMWDFNVRSALAGALLWFHKLLITFSTCSHSQLRTLHPERCRAAVLSAAVLFDCS